MSGWSAHKGPAVLLAAENIDTDQLIPARFMSTPRSAGYGDYLLYDARYDEDGRAVEHALNRHTPSILVAGRNFGSGSSREAAVYALVDFGVKVVIAPSFGDIFASNAVNNGLLPARLGAADHALLADHLSEDARDLHVDLASKEISFDGKTLAFELDPAWQTKLINGWDDIDVTQQHMDTISGFANARRAHARWAWPGGGDGRQSR